MSTRLEPYDCEKNTSYCHFGAETLLGLLPAFESQIDGVESGEDIENVHKMRVTSRRIRAAMPLFRPCFRKKRYKEWLKEIRKVTRFLGAARDLDVQIAFVENYARKLDVGKSSIGPNLLLNSYKNRRVDAQSRVLSGLEELRNSSVLQSIRESCQQTLKELANVPIDPSSVQEKAYLHVLAKVDDFLAMEDCVYRENDVLRHHEMRICAKWLRYTMEVFSPLYEGGLSEQIAAIKSFQDTLGEMHDCDVWIEHIPRFIVEMKAELASRGENKEDITGSEQTLEKFLEYVRETRKTRYRDFVRLWEETQQNDFFERLGQEMNTAFKTAENRMKEALAKPGAKIAVLADVHGNLHALEAVIQDAERRGISVFLNAGDFLGFGAFPNEVVELLRAKNTVSIVGNYDLEVMKKNKEGKGQKKLALKFAKKELAKSCENYLRSLPRSVRLDMAGKKLLMVHGSPDSIEEHIYPDTSEKRLKELARTANADVVIMGHTHLQMVREADGVSFINPGSVGRPDDGNPQTAYAVLISNLLSVELIRLDYDVDATADALRKKGLPESFAQMLLRGVSLDAVVAEDIARDRRTSKDCGEMVKAAREVAKKYWQDTDHPEQVRKLALKLFDSLIHLHRMKARERCWLECAAVLHDVGLSQGTRGHHKTSLKLILNDTQLPFSSVQRCVVGSIARYHRKGFPKEKHYNLAALNPTVKRRIILLSSLLRVADALDFTHQSIVEKVEAKAGPKKVTLECVVRGDPTLEEQAVNKKKDMFEESFKRNLIVEWKKP
jgi:putative phosphoesterase